MEFGLPHNLGNLTTPIAQQHPDEIAMMGITKAGIQARTFQELEDHAETIRAYLCEHNVRAGDRVALVVGNQIEYVEALLGTLRAGAIAVPINVSAGTERIRSILADSVPRGIIANASLHPELVCELSRADITVRIVVNGSIAAWDRYEAILEQPFSRNAQNPAHTRSAMYVYTSGSTGRPKGVMVSHKAALHPISASPYYRGVVNMASRQRSLIAMPLTHEAAFASIKEMLGFGGTAVLLEQFRAPVFLKYLAALKCTTTKVVPSMAVAILAEQELLKALDFSSLRLISIGGAPSDKTLLMSLQGVFPRATVVQFYGMTECGNIFTRRTINDKRPPVDSLGAPAKQITVKLGEDDSSNAGELYVKTPTMMEGYHAGADASRLAGGWLRTGDAFTRDADGFYYFKGRVDDMFVSGGENVFPVEVENVLLRHPDVKMVCACAVPDYARGQAPVAFVVRRSNSSLTEDELLTFYSQTGAAFAKPEAIYFVHEMPLNQTGKIDRLALIRKAQQTHLLSHVSE